MVSSPKQQRRKSIAVVDVPNAKPTNKFRPRSHSLAAVGRARRSMLAPRKSILKMAPGEEGSSSQGTEDETMDTRKLMSRRVSFASRCTVRTIPRKRRSSASDMSSPNVSIEEDSLPDTQPSQRPPPVQSDENNYPGAKQRRSSARFSMASSAGEQSMNLTNVYSPVRGSNWDDEAEDSEEMDMDDTEDLKNEIWRRQSLAAQHENAQAGPSTNPEVSYYSDGSMSMSQDDFSEDFVPLKRRSSRPPAHEDPDWLALRALTGNGAEPYVPPPASDTSSEGDYDMNYGMEQELELHRINGPRPSIPALNPFDAEEPADDTISSDGGDQSFDMEGTVNLSRILGRPQARSSLANTDYAEEEMEMTQILGIRGPLMEDGLAGDVTVTEPVVAGPSSNVTPSIAPSPELPAPPPAESAPGSSTAAPIQQSNKPASPQKKTPFTFTAPAAQSNVTIPKPFSFTTRPPSPAKSSIPRPVSPSKAKPTFSAAFAPPTTSPKKATQKRVLSEPDPSSPSKKRVVSTVVAGHEVPHPVQVSPPKDPTNEREESSRSAGAPVQPPDPKAAPTMRRMSSAFSNRRRSFAPNLGGALLQPQQDGLAKKAGRLSLASGPSNAWQRFDRNQPLPEPRSRPQTLAHVCERESQRQRTASPSPTRGSPSPAMLQDMDSIPTPEEETPDVVEISMDETIVREVVVPPPSQDQNATNAWVEGMQQEEGFDDEYDGPPISVTQFLEMTGIKFMDEITAPRRSSMHPSSSQARRSSLGNTDIPLATYFSSLAIDLPQLSLYNRISNELKEWIDKTKEEFRIADEEAVQMTPELFREYASADEEGRKELANQLTLIRHNMRGKAKAEWYEWKLEWIHGLHETVLAHFQQLESDANYLQKFNSEADTLIPEKRRECEEVREELERDQAEVDEIESGDQEYLTELKSSISEQGVEVEVLKAEVADGAAQLQWIEEQLQQVDRENQQMEGTINERKRVSDLQENGKGGEIFKLQKELESLQALHQLRLVHVKQDLLEFEYASKLHVAIPCVNFVPRSSEVTLRRLDSARTRFKDSLPSLSNHLLSAASAHIRGSNARTCSQIVRYLADFWSSCTQIRSQLRFLNSKFPLRIIPSERPGDFQASATVLFPYVQGKALVSFGFTHEIVVEWPFSITRLQCEVEVKSGPIVREDILNDISGRLQQATPADHHEFLLDACLLSLERYQ